MAWYLWVDDDKVATNCSDLSTLSEKSAGFQGGKAANAKNVNAALRQANLVACALMDVIDSEGTLAYTSSRTDVYDKLSVLNKHLYMHNVHLTAKASDAEYVIISVIFYDINSTKYTNISEIVQSFPPLYNEIEDGNTAASYVFPASGVYTKLSSTIEKTPVSGLEIQYDKAKNILVLAKIVIYEKNASGSTDRVTAFVDHVVQLF